MAHASELVDSIQNEMFSMGIFGSYRNQVKYTADLFTNTESLGAQRIATAMQLALRAELPLVPIVRHGECNACLYIGKLASDYTRVFEASSMHVSVDRVSVRGLNTDFFSTGQLSFLFEQADMLETNGVVFSTDR